MTTRHLIAQCCWQTAFDQEAKVQELQDFISLWSNTALTGLLEQCFNELCPTTQTWRITTLELDLGDILFDDLAYELPRRLTASVHRALGKMLAHEQIAVASNDGGTLRIMDHVESMQDFVSWFLQHGTVPWWFSGTESALQILDRQLEHNPGATIDIIRYLGRSQRVRQRLVWQLGEARIRSIIRLLEPWQGDFICIFADDLFTLQQERHLPASGASVFRESVWLTILKHLLVDRGTLFNTTSFVRANLWQVAQHYQIDYQRLLDQMFQAVAALESLGAVSLTFFNAIKMIYRQDHGTTLTAVVQSVEPADPWRALQKMLHYGLRRQAVGADTVQVDELFSVLARQDAARMAKLLLLEGHSVKTRQGILKHFSFNELALLVQVAEPQQHSFILAHVQHTQTQIRKQKWNKETVWQVVLAYLLTARSSKFNRRQLVHETLLDLCKLHGFELAVFLDLLIYSVQTEHPNHQHFELLGIFKELRREQNRRHSAAGVRTTYWQAALHYLKTGTDGGYGLVAGTQGQRILDNLSGGGAERSLAMLLGAAELHTTSSELLSLRLLRLVGAADLSLLIDLLEPEATEFCVSLIDSLLFWQKRAALPALDGVDLAHQVPALLIQALAGASKARQGAQSGFEPAVFWRDFVALLKHKCGVNSSALSQQIAECLVQDLCLRTLNAKPVQQHSSIHSSLQYLSNSLLSVIHAGIGGAGAAASSRHSLAQLKTGHYVFSLVPDKKWSPDELLAALRHRLTPQGAGSVIPLSEGLDAAPQGLDAVPLAALWQQLEQGDRHSISDWLERQPDKYLLLNILSHKSDSQPIGHWLSKQLPDELKPAKDTIKHWALLWQKAGYWQGASAVLEKHLAEIFWTLSFDARAHHLSASELLVRMITSACLRLNVPLSECVESFRQQKHLLQKTHWNNAYRLLVDRTSKTAEQGPKLCRKLSVPPDNTTPAEADKDNAVATSYFSQDYLASYLNHSRFIDIARCMLQQGQPPSWLRIARPIDLSRLLFDVFTVNPKLLAALLGDLQHQHGVMFRLLSIVPFAWLMDAMRVAAPQQQTGILLLDKFQRCLQRLELPNSTARQRDALLFQLVLKHWLNNDWAALAPDQFVSNFLYQLMRQQQIDIAVLQTAFAPQLKLLAQPLQLATTKVLNNTEALSAKKSSHANAVNQTKGLEARLADAITAAKNPVANSTPMRINNAGLVILQGFITMLFSRLGLVENEQFVTPVAQRRAVHYLQFLATGCSETAEQHLVLNKLLCGLALHEPVEIGIDISAYEADLCHGLLNSVIGHWEAIGSSSVDGCRGDWLVREGSLTDAKDHWDLVVDRRAYDVLLARAPFSYSVIKLPWMEKAIYVTWPT
ncbi:MAG: hypothetical protein KJ556_04150 [Gammaproteobacteria bacterium]|nr:hypothetical protein [Gammaproteobacteria bacterium]MBU2057946.1 hypothetical protein [Gammaproteobacteria bacterium]MBU2174298.1 hypothetical protein [Gammaproteobacteria bacterium]MBU2247751.1 hypothetical protein [Gammaproteobacteria bacterium]MBU2344277.1 hypothetical protein [Gammaproteobacteria bacterium]